jgi:hypothetical protein
VTFAAPWFLAVGLAAAGAVVLLHFLARRQPPAFLFPPARFVPPALSHAPAAARRPSDLWLLLIRIAALVLLGAAFARPALPPARHTARIILADGSRAVASVAELADSVRTMLAEGDRILVYDSVPRAVGSPGDLALSPAAASLSAGLIAALRQAERVGRRADSIELVIVSPFAAEAWDAATDTLRGLWAGRARLVRIAPAAPVDPGVALRAEADDPVRAAVTLAGLLRDHGDAPVRLTRVPPTMEDTTWSRNGGTLVFWPAQGTRVEWPAGPGDTVGAVVVQDGAVVAPFVRVLDPPDGAASGWWVDGRVAATVNPLGEGCVVNVAIPLAGTGDVALRPATQRLVASLTRPCGRIHSSQPVDSARLARLAGTGPLLATARAGPGERRRVPASGWLVAGAVALVLVEPLVRRNRW